ncbi:MAG: alpha-mannosidase [Bacteroidales bacterium]|nr:alpha-mannosidase [Bacteroidales bacterium]
MKRCYVILILFAGLSLANPGLSQPLQTPLYNLSRTPVLYTVGYAHLDTEWRWDYESTINDFLKATMDENFDRFEKYPSYVFTFSGARRYRMMKEYYPERYMELKKWIIRDRWFVGGSSVDECDPNVPSPESIIRQVLYGNNYFRSEYGKESVDFLLPDCFGFQAHFPSVLNHCGLKGFSTQKLSWGSANGIPFAVGTWTGPDGKGILSALNATSYTSGIQERLDTSAYWSGRVLENGRKYGVYADFRYYGVGDVGGAPREEDVQHAVGSLNHPDSKIQVYLSSSDQLFRDLTPEQAAKLPSYSGDLLLTEHSSGSITSQAYMKRWNRKNELLAQSAEPLAVMADYLGAIPYPKERLNEAWWLVLGCQMHDILPGTSIPSAYEYAWNDEVLALNMFSGVLQSSAGAVIRAMETTSAGIPLVVYNPLSIEREDVVEATLEYPDGAPDFVRVFGPDGEEALSQIISRTKTGIQLLFLARIQSLGLACYDIRNSKQPSALGSSLRAGRLSLENDSYRILINTNGNIHSILDKNLEKELLSGNMKLEFLKEHPRYWPAWNMDWNDRQKPPIGFVEGQAKTSLVEDGPVRKTYKIERVSRNSHFTQWVSLTSGESGKRIIIDNEVAWQSKGVSLKASFPLTASNNQATYNLGLGTIERPINHEKKYEVPSREWFDLTDRSGKFGITILEDCKFGSDMPNDFTLRLTLLHTPYTNEYHDQATQDWGTHNFTFGIYGHAGDWRSGLSEWQGRAVNQPLIAFRTTSHPGFLGKKLSLASLDTSQVAIRAMKLQENGKRVIVRVQELFGESISNVTLTMPGFIASASEVDGQEKELQSLVPKKGLLQFSLTPFELKSFMITLMPSSDTLALTTSSPVSFFYNEDVVSPDSLRTFSSFGKSSPSIPAELFPEEITVDGIRFVLGGVAGWQLNALACDGQKVEIPKTGQFNKLYILASAAADTTVTFKSGRSKQSIRVQGYSGNIGQYDKRIWDQYGQVSRIEPGFIKRDEVAWFAPHLHNDTANIPYRYAYLFKYELDIDPTTGSVQLPEDPSVKIFAMTLANNAFDEVQPVQPLYDDFSGRKPIQLNMEQRYVTEEMTPAASVAATRKRTVDELPVKVTTKDYASVLKPNGVTVNYLGSELDDANRKPWSSIPVSVINDGMFDLMPGDSARDIWYDEGEGRLVIDLQKSIDIDSLHIFSSLDLARGAQSYSVWGYPDKADPAFTGNPSNAGWSFIALARPIDLWGGGKAVCQFVMDPPTNFRYLMFVSESGGHGPVFFREVDVFEKQK